MQPRNVGKLVQRSRRVCRAGPASAAVRPRRGAAKCVQQVVAGCVEPTSGSAPGSGTVLSTRKHLVAAPCPRHFRHPSSRQSCETIGQRLDRHDARRSTRRCFPPFVTPCPLPDWLTIRPTFRGRPATTLDASGPGYGTPRRRAGLMSGAARVGSGDGRGTGARVRWTVRTAHARQRRRTPSSFAGDLHIILHGWPTFGYVYRVMARSAGFRTGHHRSASRWPGEM